MIGNYDALPFRQIYIVIGRYTADIDAYLKYKNMHHGWREGSYGDYQYSYIYRYRNKYNLIYYCYDTCYINLYSIQLYRKEFKNDLATNVPIHWRFIVGPKNKHKIDKIFIEGVLTKIEESLRIQQDTLEIIDSDSCK